MATTTTALMERIGQFESMRHHHARICAGLKDGVYPDSEYVKVGELVDDLARQISETVTNWRDMESAA